MRISKNHYIIRRRVISISLLTLSFVLSLVPGPAEAGSSHPTVLILNSYHQGEEWSDNELVGVTSTLRQFYPDLAPSIEHLDTKRFPSADHLIRMERYLADKYAGRKIDLLIVLDNPALDLIFRLQNELFAGVPVVFAGINGYRPEMIKGHEKITGVAETQDVTGTIKLSMTLQPGLKRVLAVHDYTSSGLAVRREMEQIIPIFQDKLEIAFSPDVSFPELETQLKALPPDTIVCILTYVTDKSGRTFTRAESTQMISSVSSVPVYAMHETRLGHGIVGGMLLEGKQHGRQAAEIALRVLAGEDPSLIPVVNSRSSPVFDYNQLTRFKLPFLSLPSDALIINRPVSYWEQYRSVLLPAAVIGALLIFLVIILSLTIMRMKKTEKKLHYSRQEYRLVFENANEAILVVQDGKLTFFNAKTIEMMGYSLAEIISLSFTDLIHPDDRDRVMKRHEECLTGMPVQNPFNGYASWKEMNCTACHSGS
ncbi:MAG: PAS domain S-box protein [Deltaproteobacteria bacterium]|nr:PAS domain S-box protein [Deltaproteobacteria bacterium]